MDTLAKLSWRWFWLSLTLSMELWCCASSVPVPPHVRHPKNAFIEVPYPPPAALVEVVPVAPSSSLVWLDGYWSWQDRFYIWIRGGWVFVAAGTAFAPWQTFYTGAGQLMFAPGAWYAASGTRVQPPEIRVPAYSPPNEATPEFQTAR